jgi:ribonucleoside-diphosphate reductase alpha chain
MEIMSNAVYSEFEKISLRRKQLQAAGEVPEWYTTQSLIMFERKYAWKGETVKGAFERIANRLCKHYTDDVELAREKFNHIMWKGLLAPSTPVMCNTGTNRGLVVSCAGSYVDDSIYGFYSTALEVAVLSKNGFGTSTYLGDIRPRGTAIGTGGEADGVVNVFDTMADVTAKVSQGNNRRGQCGNYLPIDHGDFWELAGYILKNPASANIGWMFSAEAIAKLQSGDEELIKRFNRVMYLRARTGKGYIWKPDTANRMAPQAIKNAGFPIKASNLCVEIALPQDDDHTFTCVLSSLNLTRWDEFEEDTIFWAIAFLDCVVSEMLEQIADPDFDGRGMEKAVRFTQKSRAIGLGALGFHSYLQSKMVPFDGLHAHIHNNLIFSEIRKQSLAATIKLGVLYGVPLWCEGTGQRNATTNAIAPNMSSAVLAGGVSQGIEPMVSNCFNQKTAAGELTRMNPMLVGLMRERGVYSLEVMDDLAMNYDGSVQHVDWLSDFEKSVFKTAYEMNQLTLVRMASMRQRDVDQGQSLNTFFAANEDELVIAEVHKVALLDPNIKGLYYLRSGRGMKASTGECVACEG